MFASRYLDWLGAALGAPARSQGLRSSSGQAVLGYATGYGPADLEPFVRSLRAHFAGEIVLTVDPREDVLDFLTGRGVTALVERDGADWSPHPVMQRFAAWNAWLSDRPDIGHVLLTDVRDVVFQADPFADAPAGLEVYVERDGVSLAGHAFNRKHIRALVGDRIADQIADRPCICVGTVLGEAGVVARLCRTMLLLAAIPRSHIGGAFGADQAACNLAVHLGLVPADIRPNHDRVATIGEDDGDRLVWRDDGIILNPDGGFSPIVHQYDRHRHLADGVRTLWGQPGHCVIHARRKSLDERCRRLLTSVGRRLPELR